MERVHEIYLIYLIVILFLERITYNNNNKILTNISTCKEIYICCDIVQIILTEIVMYCFVIQTNISDIIISLEKHCSIIN